MSAEDVLDLDDSFQSWSGLSRNASNHDVGGSRTHLVDSDEEEVDQVPWKGGPFPRASSHPQAQQEDRTKRDSSSQEAAKRRLPSFENIQQHCSTGRFDLLWRLMSECIPEDKVSIQREIVRHVEYTLACTRLNFAKKHAFQVLNHSNDFCFVYIICLLPAMSHEKYRLQRTRFEIGWLKGSMTLNK